MHDTQGDVHPTFAILTTEANALVSQVHNRMPVILKQESERSWIDFESTPETLFALLDSYPPTLLQMYEVSTRVNCTAEDSLEMIKPID